MLPIEVSYKMCVNAKEGNSNLLNLWRYASLEIIEQVMIVCNGVLNYSNTLSKQMECTVAQQGGFAHALKHT